jgi:ParB-like chromosome segregation protein Spo0J
MPILADETGLVLGHGRLMAAKQLGYLTVPVVVARGWTENQKRGYVIADNRLTDASEGATLAAFMRVLTESDLQTLQGNRGAAAVQLQAV